MSLHLATLILLASSAPTPADQAFELRRRAAEPPTPDPTWGQGAGAMLLLPVPRKGRECPTCGRIVGLDVLICDERGEHRETKTRRVTLDSQGRPVRRRK